MVNEKYLGHLADDCVISWAQDRRGKRSIRLGSYWPERKLIRVHPALDQAFVPRYVIESIVYHEALHRIMGVERTEAGNQAHTSRFRVRESWFPDFEKGEKWIEDNLNRLLRRR